MKNLVDRVRAVREAGMVERVHVVPHQQPYPVGYHSWGVAILLHMLWPDKPNLVPVALFHDVPERWTGDSPSPFILRNPPVQDALFQEDIAIALRLNIPSEHALTGDDLRILKAADKLELWLWTYDEEAMGNRSVLGVRKALDRMFKENPLPEPAMSFVAAFREQGWQRHGELFPYSPKGDRDG